MLTVKNVTKKYGNFTALDNIAIEFGNGVYGIVAPNGAGKTTLIKMLATLSFPTSGEILCDGTEITKLDEKYREIIGFLPQQFGYYKDYTPVKYLKYLAALKGVNEGVDEKISELLKLVSLEDVANKKMKKFSGGMIQRVGIAQALLNDPKILLLDEPTAGLDPKERVRFRNIISSLSKDKTVLLSTHIVSDVESIANKIVMIKDHKILYNDSVEDICSRLDTEIFELTISDAQFDEFTEKYQVLSHRYDGGTIKIRFAGEGVPGAVPVKPTLEDVFLYSFRD